MELTEVSLESAEKSNEIDKLWKRLMDHEYVRLLKLFSQYFGVKISCYFQDPSIQKHIAKSIRFFGKNIGKLQESSDSILKLARAFLVCTLSLVCLCACLTNSEFFSMCRT
jgi:hypothetical protein